MHCNPPTPQPTPPPTWAAATPSQAYAGSPRPAPKTQWLPSRCRQPPTHFSPTGTWPHSCRSGPAAPAASAVPALLSPGRAAARPQGRRGGPAQQPQSQPVGVARPGRGDWLARGASKQQLRWNCACRPHSTRGGLVHCTAGKRMYGVLGSQAPPQPRSARLQHLTAPSKCVRASPLLPARQAGGPPPPPPRPPAGALAGRRGRRQLWRQGALGWAARVRRRRCRQPRPPT